MGERVRDILQEALRDCEKRWEQARAEPEVGASLPIPTASSELSRPNEDTGLPVAVSAAQNAAESHISPNPAAALPWQSNGPDVAATSRGTGDAAASSGGAAASSSAACSSKAAAPWMSSV